MVFPGRWLQADGDYLDAEGELRRVAVSLGPEHGTVGPEQVKEAAKEATRGSGFDLLVICGFSFDARAGETAREFAPQPTPEFAVSEETRSFGRLPVLLARMNPDLTMAGAWFIDSDYNGESFFVRHAYFTGADDPYARLKRALKADVDEDAWASLYRTVSRPFPPPTTGRIAVKLINHYGDEVLKVYDAP